MQCNGAAGVLSNIIRVFKLAMFISWCTIAYRSFKWCYVHFAKENTIFWPSAEITPKCGWIHPVLDFPSPLKKSFDIQWNICGFYLITYYRIILWKRNFGKKLPMLQNGQSRGSFHFARFLVYLYFWSYLWNMITFLFKYTLHI
jgi:hypothetical protein